MADTKLTTIWKFPLSLAERQVVSMPARAVFLHLGFDANEDMCMWAAVDADAPKFDIEIVIVGTGNPLPHVGTFLGSVVDGSFVWHLFTGPAHAIERNISLHYQTKGGS